MLNSKYYNCFMFSYRIVRRFFAARFEPFNLMREKLHQNFTSWSLETLLMHTTLYYSLKWERWLTFNLLYTGSNHHCNLKIGI